MAISYVCAIILFLISGARDCWGHAATGQERQDTREERQALLKSAELSLLALKNEFVGTISGVLSFERMCLTQGVLLSLLRHESQVLEGTIPQRDRQKVMQEDIQYVLLSSLCTSPCTQHTRTHRFMYSTPTYLFVCKYFLMYLGARKTDQCLRMPEPLTEI